MPMYFRQSARPWLAMLAFVGASAISRSARADTAQTFTVRGTLQSGATFTGTATVDTDPANGVPYFLKKVMIKVTGPHGCKLKAVAYQSGGDGTGSNAYYKMLFSPDDGANCGLGLFFQATNNSLINYNGGPIFQTITSGGLVYASEFYYYDEHGNQVADDLVSGSLAPTPTTCGQLMSQSQFQYEFLSEDTLATQFVPPVPLDQAATICGVTNFNWQQQITNMPLPNPFYYADSPHHKTNFQAPPNIFDPPEGGIFINDDGDKSISKHTLRQFPFYWLTDNSYKGNENSQYNLCYHESGGDALEYQDSPSDPELPDGDAVSFTTSLVGVLPGNVATPPYVTFTWQSTFNGKSGGIVITDTGPFQFAQFTLSTGPCSPQTHRN